MAPKLAPNYVLASLTVSLGGFLNGYDTGSIGAITTMPRFNQSIGHLSPSLLGFTVSLIMLTGALPSVFAGQLADRFGRLKIIIAGAALLGVGAVLQGSANSLPQFLVGRALAGFGQGVYLSNVSVYICEIAPVKFRGMLAGLPQFMAATGVCAGYFTCFGTVAIQSSMAWRLAYVVQGVFAVWFAVGCLVLPESPRWLMLHGKRAEALQALQRLEFSMEEAERDFLTAGTEQQYNGLSPWQGFLLLFKRGYRARTTLALFILGMVQLSGIDGVIYVGFCPAPPPPLDTL
jgi:MFS family permease